MFDYFISLGSACPIAASMDKYGLRSFSAPFDWLITPDFSWVLHYIDTDFTDFLLKENMERYDECQDHFQDKVSGFRFMHESVNFERDFKKIKVKYDRHINIFSEKARFRVCYLRSMNSEQEFEYIVQNTEYINRIVKKNNIDSEIVFLCNSDIVGKRKFPFRYYNMPKVWCTNSQIELRSYFDHASDFISFCGENYSGINLIRNLAVDFEKNPYVLIARRYKTLAALLEHDFSRDIKSERTIIYGAGVIGKELYKKIKDITSVICFVDISKKESNFEGVPIVQVEDVKREERTVVIVSAAYHFKRIKEGLADKFQEGEIISLDDILGLKF